MNNIVNKQENKPITLKSLVSQASTKGRIEELLGKKAAAFISSMIAIGSTSALKDCDPVSILSASITSATLDLPINQNLGYAYIVPYVNKGVKQAQFQMGYKGFVQLAQRSGTVAKLNVAVLSKSQFKSFDPITDTLSYDLSNLQDPEPCCYVAYLKLTNGFEKFKIMTIQELTNHAKKYSKSYNHSSSIWKTDFDAMAKKTVLKLLLQGYAPLSIELQTAVQADQSVVLGEGNYKYVDNEEHLKNIEIEDQPNLLSDFEKQATDGDFSNA